MTRNAIEAVGLSKRFVVHAERRSTIKERVARGRPPEKKKYFWALRDATFAVPAGSSLGIIGPNGSGKSTALKVLTGIYRPTSGQVTVNGSVAALLEVGAGFHPELTGRENVRLNATILGFSGRQVSAMMDEIVEFADIGEHIDAPIKHYSSGMYVRLGFAVAVMVRPEILIVDEVIAVGDEEFQRKCYDHLHRLRRDGTTMVIVSHGLGQITDLCDEALWLDHGDVQGLGPAPEVVRAYLDAVNTREAQRATADREAAVDAPAADDGVIRRGSGDLRFTGVEFLDADDATTELLVTGRPGTLRLHYEAMRPCSDVRVEVSFSDESESLVTSASTKGLADWAVPAGSGSMDLVMEPLLLADGVYDIRVEAHVAGHLADALDGGTTLTVRDPGTDVRGMYLQPGVWTLSPGAPAQPGPAEASPVGSVRTAAVQVNADASA